jgi:hypothetical protein
LQGGAGEPELNEEDVSVYLTIAAFTRTMQLQRLVGLGGAHAGVELAYVTNYFFWHLGCSCALA